MGGNKVGFASASAGRIGDVDTTQRNPLLCKFTDENGNEYTYVKGVASGAAGAWANFYGDGSTALTLSTPLGGPIGCMMAALVASTFGWLQTSGVVSATNAQGNGVTSSSIATASADKAPLYLSATPGRLTITQAAGNAVIGAYGLGAAVSNVGDAFISHPVAAGATLASS